jgi:hypothetical protein
MPDTYTTGARIAYDEPGGLRIELAMSVGKGPPGTPTVASGDEPPMNSLGTHEDGV